MKTLTIMTLLLFAAPAQAATKLSLADAIALARCRRGDVVQAELDVQLAQLNVLRAKLERVHLTIATNFTEQYEQLNMNAPPELCASFGEACNTGNEAHNFSANASLVVPLWSGFTVEADLQAAKAMHRAARADRESKLRAIVREVTGAYWAVRRAEMLLELGRIALRRNQDMAALVKARADHGIVSMVDYNRAETVVLNQKGQLASLEERVEASRAELAAVLQIDDAIELTDAPPMQGPALPSLESAIAQARAARPDIAAVQAHLDASREHVRSVKGQLWPQIALFANASVGNTAYGLPQPTMIGNFTAGVSVNWTIFDMLTTWNNVREAQYMRDRVAQDRARIDYNVTAEVRVAWIRLHKAIERRESVLKALALAVSTVDLIRKRYLTGTALLIEVLSAEAELLSLESEATDNAIEIADARAELWHASGAP